MIDNELTTTAKTRQAVDPSTEDLLPEVPVSTQEDVDKAVAAAQAAFPAWSKLSQDERAAYLTKFADAVEANQEDFAQLLGREAGKPPGAASFELFILTRQIRETLKHKLAEETIEDTDEVCIWNYLVLEYPAPSCPQSPSYISPYRCWPRLTCSCL